MHSTQIKMLDHCAMAMAWDIEGRPWISEARRDVGVAAHAVLEASQGKCPDEWLVIAERTVVGLSLNGYRFDGAQQPPLNLEACQEGAQLALSWLRQHGPEPGHAKLEVGLAVDANGDCCTYSKGALQAVIDVVREDELDDEESSWLELTVADYKTSWQADDSELETLQRKIQAVTAAAHHPGWALLRLEVRNLRTGMTHTREILRGEEGDALLDQWRREALQAAEVARKSMDDPQASPGAGCVGCPYVAACPYAERALEAPEAAQAWVVAKARAEALRPVVAKLAREGHVPVGGGAVEYRRKERQEPSRAAPTELWRYWHPESSTEEDEIIGLLETARPGVTQIRALGKYLAKTRGEAVSEDFLESALTTVGKPELVIEKD